MKTQTHLHTPRYSFFKINAYSPPALLQALLQSATLGGEKSSTSEFAPRGPPPHVPARRCDAPNPRAPALPSIAWTRIPLSASPRPDLPDSPSALGRSVPSSPARSRALRLRTPSTGRAAPPAPLCRDCPGWTTFPRSHRILTNLDLWVLFRCPSSCGPYVASRSCPKVLISRGFHVPGPSRTGTRGGGENRVGPGPQAWVCSSTGDLCLWETKCCVCRCVPVTMCAFVLGTDVGCASLLGLRLSVGCQWNSGL